MVAILSIAWGSSKILKYVLNLKFKPKPPLNTQIYTESKVVCLILRIPFLMSCRLMRCKGIKGERGKNYGEEKDFDILVKFNSMHLITRLLPNKSKSLISLHVLDSCKWAVKSLVSG